MLPLESLEPAELLWPTELRLGLLCQCKIVRSVSSTRGLLFPACGKHLQPILADGLQHRKARLLAISLGSLQQALVQKEGHPFQHVCVCVGDRGGPRFDRLEGPPTHEDREPTK